MLSLHAPGEPAPWSPLDSLLAACLGRRRMGGAKELGDHEVHLGPGLPSHPVQAKKPLAAWTKQVPDSKILS